VKVEKNNSEMEGKEKTKEEEKGEQKYEGEESEDEQGSGSGSEEESGSSAGNAESDEEERKEEKKGGDNPPEIQVSLNIEVSAEGLYLKNIGLIKVNEMQVAVQCKTCKFESVLTMKVAPFSANHLMNELCCVNCLFPGAIYFKSLIASARAPQIGSMGATIWNIMDIVSASFSNICENCGKEYEIKKYQMNTMSKAKCFQCFQETSFLIGSYRMIQPVTLDMKNPENLLRKENPKKKKVMLDEELQSAMDLLKKAKKVKR